MMSPLIIAALIAPFFLAPSLAADENGLQQPAVVVKPIPHSSAATDSPAAATVHLPQPGASTNPPSSTNPPLPSTLPTLIVAGVTLGSACQSNATCHTQVPNSVCSGEEHVCVCMDGFFENPAVPGVCKLAPGYGEPCASPEQQTGATPVACRLPFVCNSTSLCDCPAGYIQEFFQCIRDCPSDAVPTFDGCLPARQLGDPCGTDEQCVQSYAQCLHGRCQCIAGASHVGAHCAPVNQCPMGEPARDLETGGVRECKADGLDACPKEHYCLFAQNKGICCPKIRMNCPIGKALEGHNCSTCPWHTHHCFSYVIGSYSDSMCCPNACPTTQPILHEGRCHARAPFGGHCAVDLQCAGVPNAVCRRDGDEEDEEGGAQMRCLCPSGDGFRNKFGRCIRQSHLGGKCLTDEECVVGSNTLCVDGHCACYQGYMPEPDGDDEQTAAGSAKCIAEPSCPTASGVEMVASDRYVQCDGVPAACGPGEFCRKWWFDGRRTFSLCCPLPSLTDYEAICAPFRMRLILKNELEKGKKPDFQDAEPLRCKLSRFNLVLMDSQQPVVDNNVPKSSSAGNTTNGLLASCPTGASCLFDPFSSVNAGVCCRPDNTGNMLPPASSLAAVVQPNKRVKPAAETSVDGEPKKEPAVVVRPAPAAVAVDPPTKTNMLR